MLKAKVLAKHSEKSVQNERQILARLGSKFIVNMSYAFQDRETLYLVLDYLAGGDLRYHMIKRKTFTESETKFFVVCILLGLEYIHSMGVLHRDIKPENLVFDKRGYLKITDFGIARIWKPNNAAETSGTPGYMAPEVMCKQNHGIAVDYFALGVIAYECMLGKRPYQGLTRKEIREQILAKQAQIKAEELPKGWNTEAMDFINSLIQRKPINRLGTDGIKQIFEHPWLVHFPWKEVREQKYIPSFIPSGKEDNFQFFSGSDYGEKKELEEQIRSCELLLHQDSIQGKFDGYYYDVKSAADVSSTRGIIITIPPECKSPSSSSSTKKSK